MKKITFILLLTSIFNFAQTCDCEKNFQWVKETFEKNDAGFEYALEIKGKNEYDKHNAEFLEKVKTIEDNKECAQTLYDWLKFFRSGHMGISLNNSAQTSKGENKEEDHSSHEVFKMNEKKFEKSLKNIPADSYEGIWVSEPYKIAITKNGNEFIGSIIEAPETGWTKNQVKLKIYTKDNQQVADYYMRDFSKREMDEVRLIGKNTLKLGFITLSRFNPTFEDDKNLKLYIKSITTNNPFIEEIDRDNLLLRIPSFAQQNKKIIDSVIATNQKLLSTHKNLFIDIRGNGGGSDGSFKEILPYLYTQPIRTIGVEMLSTPLNNKRMEDFLENPDIGKENKEWIKKALKKLNDNLGEFVMMNEYPVSVYEKDSIYAYPKNVAILINKSNGSTTEQFLLAAKQSMKVKLFGVTTMGVLDISNMYFVDSPCKEFKLGYSLSKSLRIPEFEIDDKGIQPDFYIDKSIPDEAWLGHVYEIVNTL